MPDAGLHDKRQAPALRHEKQEATERDVQVLNHLQCSKKAARPRQQPGLIWGETHRVGTASRGLGRWKAQSYALASGASRRCLNACILMVVSKGRLFPIGHVPVPQQIGQSATIKGFSCTSCPPDPPQSWQTLMMSAHRS